MTAVLLLFIAAYLLFFNYPEHTKVWLEAEASRILGREVQIKNIYVDFPNAFEIHGIRAFPERPGLPWLELESLRGEIRFTALIQRELRLSLLQVNGLVLRIQDYGGGEIDLPGLDNPEPEESVVVPQASVAFLVDRVRFEDAAFLYQNHTLPWHLMASDLSVGFDRTSDDYYRGTLTYQEGELQVMERPPVTASVDARVDLVGRELRVTRLTAKGTFYQLEAQGKVSFGTEAQAELSIELESLLGPAARSLLGTSLLNDRGEIPSTFQGNLSVGRGWHLLQGEVRVPGARFAGFPVRDFRGDFFWDRSVIELRNAEGHFAQGIFRFDLQQPLPFTEHASRLTAHFQDLSLETLVLAQTGQKGPLASRISGSMELDIPLFESERLSGDFDLVGKAPEGTAEGLDFSANGVITQGDLSLDASRFQTPSAVLSLSGEYPWEGPAKMAMELDSNALARTDWLQQRIRAVLSPNKPSQTLGVTGTGRVKGRVLGKYPEFIFEGDFQGSHVTLNNILLGDLRCQGSLNSDTVRFDTFRASKSDADLAALHRKKLEIVYLGLESGSDEVLRRICKEATAAEMIEAVNKAKRAEIRVSVIALLGIGGTELSAQHAEQTGRIVSAMDPHYLSMLTLMLVPGTELHRQWQAGTFQAMEPQNLLAELRQVITNLDGLSRCIFRTNHASNYVPLAGTLSRDKTRLLTTLDQALAQGESALRPEQWRAL